MNVISARSVGNSLFILSKTSVTLQYFAGFPFLPPLNTSLLRFSTRMVFELLGPRTNNMASRMFDFPLPLGPVIPVKLPLNGILILPANVLKFSSSTYFSFKSSPT